MGVVDAREEAACELECLDYQDLQNRYDLLEAENRVLQSRLAYCGHIMEMTSALATKALEDDDPVKRGATLFMLEHRAKDALKVLHPPEGLFALSEDISAV